MLAVDTGWSLISYAWGSPVSGILILVGIGLNLLLLVTNFTKTLMIDFWNYWSFLACGAIIYGATENVVWAVVATAIYMVITWKWSDFVAPIFQEASGMEGCTWPTGAVIAPAMIGFPVIKLCQKLPVIKDVKADPEALQEKLGIFGETMVMGAIIGVVIGILAGFDPVNIFLLGVNMGAVMILLPRMIAIMMEGLLPIAGAAQEFCEKRLHGKQIWLGIDASTLMGNPCNMTVIMLMTPIVTVMSILPGNRMLAVASLVAIPWFIIPLAYYAKDNILHTLIAAIVVFAVYFLCATALAEAHTNIAYICGSLKNTETLTSCLSEEGKKFSGNSQYAKEGRVMHHGTIMYDSDLEILSKALAVSSDKMKSKACKSVRSRVTNVKPYIGEMMSTEQFFRILREFMFQENQMIKYRLKTEELQAVRDIQKKRYDTWDWNYGFSPNYAVEKKRRVENCGTVEIHIDVKKGQIERLAFSGDYFSSVDSRYLADYLVGVKLNRQDLEHQLEAVEIRDYFHNLSKDEFVQMLLE